MLANTLAAPMRSLSFSLLAGALVLAGGCKKRVSNSGESAATKDATASAVAEDPVVEPAEKARDDGAKAPGMSAESAKAAALAWMRAIGAKDRAKILELAGVPFAVASKLDDDACQAKKVLDNAADLDRVAACLTGDDTLVEMLQEGIEEDLLVAGPTEERKKLSLGDLEPCERSATWPDVAASYVVATHVAGDGVNASLCLQLAPGESGPEVRGVAVEWESYE